MSTDNFAGISDSINNICQSTYTELIYTREVSGKAIKPVTDTVESSLVSLAFGKKKKANDHIESDPKDISATKQSTISYRTMLANVASSQSVNSQRAENELKDILKSTSTIPSCASTITSVNCSEFSKCKYDIVFAVQSTTSAELLHTNLESSVGKFLDMIGEISNNDYRAGLVIFGTGASSRVNLTSVSCGAATKTNVVDALISQYNTANSNYHKNFVIDELIYRGVDNSVNSGQYLIFASDSTVDSISALKLIITGGAGLFRSDAQKIIVLVTNRRGAIDGVSVVNGVSYSSSDHTDHQMNAVARDAAECGFKIVGVNFNNPDWAACCNGISQYPLQALTSAASITGGVYVESLLLDTLSEKLTTYFNNDCLIVSRPCVNKIINGTFITNIDGWEPYDIETVLTPVASWDQYAHNGSSCLKLSYSGIKQTINNLMPGNKILLSFNSHTLSDLIVKIGTEEFTAEPFYVSYFVEWHEYSFEAVVDESGSVTISFESPGGNSHIDDVILCESIIDDCGIGTTNLINNSFFTDGIDGWTDGNGDALSDSVTDPKYWSSSTKSILIGANNAPVVMNTISGLSSGQNMIFSFEFDHIPHESGNLELKYSIDDGDTVLLSGSILNNSITEFPSTLTIPFIIPSTTSGTIEIKFTAGSNSGEISVSSAMCCSVGNECGPGQVKISFDDFETTRGGWSGGVVENHAIKLSGISTLTQTFIDLPENSVVTVKFTKLFVGSLTVELQSGSVINQFIDDGQPGVKSYECDISDSGVLVVKFIHNNSIGDVIIDDILICYAVAVVCDGFITNVKSRIEWNGIPRVPVNIFGIVARYTFRDVSDPFITEIFNSKSASDGRFGTTTPTTCNGQTTCDFWKQNGYKGAVETTITSASLNNPLVSTDEMVDSSTDGKFQNITTFLNWLWSIPASSVSTSQDQLITTWPDPPPKFVQSVEFLVLVNKIDQLTAGTPVCDNTFSVAPDPAETFDLILNFTNSNGMSREFRNTIDISDIYSETIDFSDPWDTLSSVGHGVRGVRARWLSSTFDIDTVGGNGLDQCTQSIPDTYTGSGTLLLPGLAINGGSSVSVACESDIKIEIIDDGYAINTIQSVVLPNPTSGYFTVTITLDSISNTAILPWNVTADLFRSRIAELSIINSLDNVMVTGDGSPDDPFLIEFTGAFAASDIPLMQLDSTRLVGIASGYVDSITVGTSNERQTISRIGINNSNFTIKFSNVTSTLIAFNSSLNSVQEKLEIMESIGAGNVIVSGNIIDRDAPYYGPWYIDFVGVLANQNVPLMTVSSGYSIISDWQGVVGTNDKQMINIDAKDGSYSIILLNPDVTGESVETIALSYNANASAISAAIIGAASWLLGSVTVTDVDYDPNNPNVYQRIVEFNGVFSSTPMPNMSIDGTLLVGGSVLIEKTSTGSGSPTKQNITLYKASGGYFNLFVDIDDVVESSINISWNCTPSDVSTAISAMSFFDSGDVTVVSGRHSFDPNVSASFIVTFDKKFGSVPVMMSEDHLVCSSLSHDSQSPPYDYGFTSSSSNSFGCSPTTILSQPEQITLFDDYDDCCSSSTIKDSANVYNEVVLERDLFDPTKLTPVGKKFTIKDLAVIKGLKSSDYIPYVRNFNTGVFSSVDYSTNIESKMSIILIGVNIDSVATRNRLKNKISANEILPERVVF